MDKVCFAPGEVNAAIVKEFLIAHGIKTTIAPDGMPFMGSHASQGPTQQHAVYVERDKVDMAMGLLKENGFLPK